MTILYAMRVGHRIKIKQIHELAKEHLRSWLPLLPSYEAFIRRINKLSEAFRSLTYQLKSSFCPKDCDLNKSLLDSLPIRKPSVAKKTPIKVTVPPELCIIMVLIACSCLSSA